MSSRLPNDDLTPTFAQNYGLDGFTFFEDYGEASMTQHRLEEASKLPGADTTGADELGALTRKAFEQDGAEPIVRVADEAYAGTDEMGDLGAFFADNSSASMMEHSFMRDATDEDKTLALLRQGKVAPGDLSDFLGRAAAEQGPVDFTWLTEAEQNPDRLPISPNSLAELQEAWGHSRTDGLHRVTVRDLDDARYEEELRRDHGMRSAKTRREILSIARRAMRRSAAGASFREIILEASADCDEAAGKVLLPSLKLVQSEHGLAGKVFIRAAAYPGCGAGKWTEHVNKVARSAKYVVACGDCAGCVHNTAGRCGVFKKEVVPAVPWEDARDEYTPILEAEGRRVEASGDPKVALKTAIESRRWREERPTGGRTHIVPVERLTRRQAVERLQATQVEPQRQIDATRKPSQARIKVLHRIAQLERDGHLPQGSAKRASESNMDPEAMLKGALKAASQRAERQAEYSGQQNIRAMPYKSASQGVASTQDLRRLMRYAHQTMTEGFIGQELDHMLQARFSPVVLREAAQVLHEARDKHEGASGFLYVDAQAYASQRGVEGCDKGALKHRGNSVPMVLAMDRCASCIHANDGGCGKYKKQLVQASELPAAETKQYQRKMIAQAARTNNRNIPAADIFTAVDDYGLEGQTILDNFDLNPELQSPEKLGAILFDGWNVGDSEPELGVEQTRLASQLDVEMGEPAPLSERERQAAAQAHDPNEVANLAASLWGEGGGE